MAGITLVAIIKTAIGLVTASGTIVGISYCSNWMNRKNFNFKSKGSALEYEDRPSGKRLFGED